MFKLTFRYPTSSDHDLLLDYINVLSAERTFIRKQGAVITPAEEQEHLNGFLKNIEKKRAVKILAFDGDKLVGAADIRMGYGSENHVGIFGITVSKEARGQGVGKALMKKTIDEAVATIKDLEIITLSVFEQNQVARNLYKKFGFKEYGRLPRGVLRRGEYSEHLYLFLDLKDK